ncbi:alpha/beta hydrolase [Streptomyces sp. NPDC051105]|uniref:alpha/beta fold hydrolase n=1 Tax=Streptomyces sp. NPDC051105 TaxID=3154843 RepID=UPI0034164478
MTQLLLGPSGDGAGAPWGPSRLTGGRSGSSVHIAEKELLTGILGERSATVGESALTRLAQLCGGLPLARAAFCADLPVVTTRLMQATRRPFSASSPADVTQAAAWRTIPSFGLVAGEDKAAPPALERLSYERTGAKKVIEVPGASHVPMISHPTTTARFVETAVKTVS